MSHRIRAACLAATLVAGLVAVAPATAAADAAAPPGTHCRTPVDHTEPVAGYGVLNRFTVGNHEDSPTPYDRVVIALTGPATSYQVRYVPQLYQDGSGAPVELRGDADLEVRVEGAAAHDDEGRSTIAVRDHVRNWGSLRQARLFSDFEAVVLVGIGVTRAVDFRVFTLTGPDRLVIDLAMPGQHPWPCESGAVQVYFLDEPRYVANTEPFFTPVWRRVRVPAVAAGALHSLWHGPLTAEHDRGLRLVTSDALGFTGLRVADGVAHLRLTGGCDAGGSTVTVAGSIMPTLRQFPNVDYVKIYDPAGRTAAPTGRSDSIPECLNP